MSRCSSVRTECHGVLVCSVRTECLGVAVCVLNVTVY
jgi:hypothetical protein